MIFCTHSESYKSIRRAQRASNWGVRAPVRCVGVRRDGLRNAERYVPRPKVNDGMSRGKALVIGAYLNGRGVRRAQRQRTRPFWHLAAPERAASQGSGRGGRYTGAPIVRYKPRSSAAVQDHQLLILPPEHIALHVCSVCERREVCHHASWVYFEEEPNLKCFQLDGLGLNLGKRVVIFAYGHAAQGRISRAGFKAPDLSGTSGTSVVML
eukprot:6209133-Pleurochrysis_carterae.AAC.2